MLLRGSFFVWWLHFVLIGQGIVFRWSRLDCEDSRLALQRELSRQHLIVEPGRQFDRWFVDQAGEYIGYHESHEQTRY